MQEKEQTNLTPIGALTFHDTPIQTKPPYPHFNLHKIATKIVAYILTWLRLLLKAQQSYTSYIHKKYSLFSIFPIGVALFQQHTNHTPHSLYQRQSVLRQYLLLTLFFSIMTRSSALTHSMSFTVSSTSLSFTYFSHLSFSFILKAR